MDFLETKVNITEGKLKEIKAFDNIDEVDFDYNGKLDAIDLVRYNWKYTCEDVFGSATIYSKDKLSPEILDEIVLDNIIAKQIKKGHTENIRFEAKFKNIWEDIKEDEKYIDIEDLPINQQELCKEKTREMNKQLNKNYYKLILAILTIILFFVIMAITL